MWPALLDALFPRRCLICKKESAEALCSDCAAQCWPMPPRCPCCNRRSAGQKCRGCAMDAPLDVLGIAYHYAGSIKILIHRAKFHGQPAALGQLQKQLQQAEALPLPPQTVVLPMPMATRRLWQRGFNQSEALAAALAQAWRLPLNKRLLRRRHRPPQAGIIGVRKRFQNMSDAFYLTAAPPPAVLLVDDVYTSGASLGTAARLLRRAGARFVAAQVLAAT